MASFIRVMDSAPVPAARRASPASVLACWALSAFCLVIDDISSRLDEVSSRPAACSVAPSASDCDAAETCPAAAATCSAPEVRPPMIRWIGLVMLRVISTAATIPMMTAAMPTVLIIRLAVETWASASSFVLSMKL